MVLLKTFITAIFRASEKLPETSIKILFFPIKYFSKIQKIWFSVGCKELALGSRMNEKLNFSFVCPNFLIFRRIWLFNELGLPFSTLIKLIKNLFSGFRRSWNVNNHQKKLGSNFTQIKSDENVIRKVK